MNIKYKDYIDSIHHFPIEGIIYRDIQPVLADNIVFKSAMIWDNYLLRYQIIGLE